MIATGIMPLDCQIDATRTRAVMVGTGVVTIDEWAHCLAQAIRDGVWAYPTIYDLRGAADIPAPEALPSMVHDIEELAVEHGTRGPVALVSNVPLVLERLRVYAGMARELPYPTKVFTSLPDADAWLNQQRPMELPLDES